VTCSQIDGWRPQVDNLLSTNIKRRLQASFPKLYSKAVNEFRTKLRKNIRNDSKKKAALQKLLRHGPDASRPDFDLNQVCTSTRNHLRSVDQRMNVRIVPCQQIT